MSDETENKEAVDGGSTEPAVQASADAPKAATPPADAASVSETAADVMGDSGSTDDKAAEQALRKSRRGTRIAPIGIAHVKATFNNTIVTITDMRGNVVSWCSAGRAGFKGSRKSTSFAATIIGQDAARQASSKGMNEVEVHVQGAGSGRESAIRAIQTSGLTISVIKDVTPIAHNGCRPRKRRRV